MGQATGTQRADDVIRRFFAEERARASGRRVDRLRAAEHDLLACMDVLAPHLLEDPERRLLALEQQFEPVGAAARVAGPAAVLLALPVYLDDHHWQGDDVEDRRLRIRLAEPLTWEIVRLPELREADLGAAAWIVEASVQHATWLLRRERELTRRHA